MFNAEIQDDCQKWQENDFWEKSAVDSAENLRRNRSISLNFRNKRVFAFNAEIQDGRQKWQENNFCEKLPVDTADTLRVKYCVENCFYLALFPR